MSVGLYTTHAVCRIVRYTCYQEDYTLHLSRGLYNTHAVCTTVNYACYLEDYTLHLMSVGLYTTPDISRIIHYT